MKLTTEELDFIQSVITTANLLDITSIIIEPGKVRAMDEDQTTFLFQDKGIPAMQFGSIGLNRLAAFSTRLDLTRVQDGFSTTVITTGEDATVGFDKYDPQAVGSTPPMWVRSVTMSGKGVTVDYRCASPQTIKAPKNRAGINVFSIGIMPDVITMLQKGKSAMKSTEVKIVGNKKGAKLEISDINGDTLSYHFNDVIISHSGEEPNFTYTYLIDSLVPVFKTNPTGMFSLTARGSLSFTVNGLDVYFMSRS